MESFLCAMIEKEIDYSFDNRPIPAKLTGVTWKSTILK